MIALVLELCGGVCALSTIVFLALASVSKLMPDLEREARREAVSQHRYLHNLGDPTWPASP